MHDPEFKPTENGGIGIMPDWEEEWYPDEVTYRKAYDARVDYLVDEFYQWENELSLELPEQYEMVSA